MMVAMPGVIWLLAPGFTDDKAIFDLAVTFGRITFPYLCSSRSPRSTVAC